LHRVESGWWRQSYHRALEIVLISVAVNDESQVAKARREATAIARQQGFNEVDVGRVAIVVTELATDPIRSRRDQSGRTIIDGRLGEPHPEVFTNRSISLTSRNLRKRT